MTNADFEIETLMRQGLAGDRKAYSACLSKLVPRMRAMAHTDLPPALRHMAEDVVQEALLAIHLKRGSWDQTRALLPWVRIIVKRKAIDMLRSRPRASHEPIEDHENLHGQTADPLEALHLEQALERLPHRDASLLRDHAFGSEEPESIAQKFGLSPGAMRVALHRALQRLAEAARKEEEWKPRT
ncbi:sigma-70 family RNA polymerase sigma factor [Thioclava sp. GXIMD4215]|uniref:sigma-70 family RNA polymerase sigma factor n=1 Tax=Thioclava sp. GXIMD4215 TaxID=3131928 RepID=UPI00324DBF53